MPRKKNHTTTLSVIHPVCCGLDVHKDSISACLMFSDNKGREKTTIKEFTTLTCDVKKLGKWLLRRQCPIVAMESTGHYWTPIHNVLEGSVRVVLVNPRHVKNVPGRKTDIADSRWLAGLLRNGLLKGAFIPPKYQRHWRDLTRMRSNYVRSVGDYKRRVHQLFQQANIKIDSVVSQLFGLTGRNLMKLLISKGSHPTLSEVEDCLRGSLKSKAKELHACVKGFFEGHHRRLLTMLLETIHHLEAQVEMLDQRIKDTMSEYHVVMDRLIEIPGVSHVSAAAILSEVGITLEAFESANSLAAWCGLSPGNNQSANKRKSGKGSVKKNRLKTIMVEVAWPAIKKKGSYYRAKYYSLKARLGPKKTIIAIAHRIIKAIYHVIKYGVRFTDLGEAYLLERNKESKLRHLHKQAQLLGYQLVELPKQSIDPESKIFASV